MSPDEGAELLPPAGDDRYDASGKSPERIAEDIVATRAELGAILTALERRLTPQQFLEKGMDMLKDTIEGGGGGLGDMLRRHPVPLALIGMGIGWIIVAATGRGGQDDAGAPYPTAPAGIAHAREKAGEAMDRAQQAVSETAEHARDGVKTAWQQAEDFAQAAADRLTRPRRRVGELLTDHPLAFGALGLLAGVATALLLPKSAAEQRLIGPAGDELRHQAADLGRGAMARARHVAERTLGAAKDAVTAAAGEAAEAVGTGGEEKPG